MSRVRILSGFEMIGSFAVLHPDTMGGTSLPPTLYRKMTQLDSHRSASSECEIGRMMEQTFTTVRGTALAPSLPRLLAAAWNLPAIRIRARIYACRSSFLARQAAAGRRG